MSIYLPIAEISLNLLTLAALGLSVGFLSGMFGIGGGFIMTPMLIFMGVPPPVAVGTGASQVVASSVSGALAHWQRGNIDFQMAGLLILGGIGGAALGVNLIHVLSQLGLVDVFVALAYIVVLGSVGSLMLFESLREIRRARHPQSVAYRRRHRHTWLQGLPLKLRFVRSRLYMSAIPPVLVGSFIGWMTAIMGVGGGFLLIPALIYLFRMPSHIVIGTSIFQVVFMTALTTVLQAVQNFTVDLVLAVPLMLGGVIGAQYGVRASERVKPVQLRALLGLLVVSVAIRMAYGIVATPADPYGLTVLRAD